MLDIDFLAANLTFANEIENIDQGMGVEDGERQPDSKFRAKIADKPIALQMSKLMALSDQSIDQLPVALYDMFELWLVPHRFSIHSLEGSSSGLSSVGCVVDYDMNDGPTVSIVSLFPESQSVVRASVEATGRISAQAFLGPLGFVNAAESGAVEPRPSSEISASLSAKNFHMEAGWKDGPVLTMKHEIVSPILSTSGKGSQTCQFMFDRFNEPLHGRDVETFAVVATRKRRRHLSYKMKVFYEYKRIFFPVRHETEWGRVDVTLSA